jgi:hypothetical protein
MSSATNNMMLGLPFCTASDLTASCATPAGSSLLLKSGLLQADRPTIKDAKEIRAIIFISLLFSLVHICTVVVQLFYQLRFFWNKASFLPSIL